jgi:hypothetical protein
MVHPKLVPKSLVEESRALIEHAAAMRLAGIKNVELKISQRQQPQNSTSND